MLGKQKHTFFSYFILFAVLANSCNYTDKPIETIDFDLCNDFIVVRSVCNGKDSINMIFDTGSWVSCLQSGYVQKEGMEPYGTMAVNCVNGTKDLPITKATFTFGKIVINADRVVSGLNPRFEQRAKRKIDGLIGCGELYEQYVLFIDFENTVIKIFEKNQYPDTIGYTKLKLQDNWPVIRGKTEFQNNKIQDGYYVIDTGANTPLVLSAFTHDSVQLVERIGELDTLTVWDKCMIPQMRYKGKVKSLFFGVDTIFDVSVLNPLLIPEDSANLSYFHGLIGTPILKNFNIIIDYPNSDIYFKRIALKD